MLSTVLFSLGLWKVQTACYECPVKGPDRHNVTEEEKARAPVQWSQFAL